MKLSERSGRYTPTCKSALRVEEEIITDTTSERQDIERPSIVQHYSMDEVSMETKGPFHQRQLATNLRLNLS